MFGKKNKLECKVKPRKTNCQCLHVFAFVHKKLVITFLYMTQENSKNHYKIINDDEIIINSNAILFVYKYTVTSEIFFLQDLILHYPFLNTKEMHLY